MGKKSSEVATLLGEKVKLKMEGENVMVDNAKVTAADVMTSNGVVHLIDNVLVPKSLIEAVSAFKEETPVPTETPVTPATDTPPTATTIKASVTLDRDMPTD